MKLGKIMMILLALCLFCGCGQKQPVVEVDPNAVIIDPNATEAPAAAPAVTEAPAAAPVPLAETFPAQEELTELAGEDPYTFHTGDIAILPRMEAEPVLKALGEPAFMFEADSCAYQGKDVYYKFNGFELTVNTPEDKPVITAITVVDDTIRVPFENGSLSIGDPAEKLCSVMGLEPGKEQYDLHSPGVHLQFAVKDNRISAILFIAPEEY